MLAVLLVSEWVYPFSYLTETNYSVYMVAFVALSLGCFFIGLRFYYSIPLHLIILALLMALLFNGGNLFDPSFYSELTRMVINGISHMIHLNATEIGDEFIFMTFLVALWLLAYITSYSLLKKSRIMSILVLTVIYVAIIHTFTDYHGELALVRTVIIGFFIASPNINSATWLRKSTRLNEAGCYLSYRISCYLSYYYGAFAFSSYPSTCLERSCSFYSPNTWNRYNKNGRL
ncbi:hypothetical protein MAQA_07573 [Listeria aquatica FSL S10-1188]|uniref:Uncharacterized protein n=1 Tax=Listeria aquatica FSL S10-1188 TaxID=1265818 RepID=W7AUY1_9LIST|nr:hypothetical protein MAQA_07573 [Listeria aquatica FSL S10-1188]